MNNTKTNFKIRKEEIEEYFALIKVLNNDDISLEYTRLNGVFHLTNLRNQVFPL
jgi:hypothetical protein